MGDLGTYANSKVASYNDVYSETSHLPEILCNTMNNGYNMHRYTYKPLYDNASLSFGFLLQDNETQVANVEKCAYGVIEDFLCQKSSTNIQQRSKKLKQRFAHHYKLMLDNPKLMNDFMFDEFLRYGHITNKIRDIVSIIEGISFDEFMGTVKNFLNEHNKTLVVSYELINTSK